MSIKKAFSELTRFLYRSRRTLILIIVVTLAVIISHTLIAIWLSRSYGVNVPSIGSISVTGVEAYGGDLKLIDGVISIDWGNIHYGESKTVSFNLRSMSSLETRLAFNVTGWNPEDIKNYLTLSWNYNGTQLLPQQEIPVGFTLSTADTSDFADYLVAKNVTSYSFTIHIYSTG